MIRLRFAIALEVFRDPFSVALGLVVTAAAAVGLAWAGQIVQSSPIGGIYWDLAPSRLIAIALVALGFGVVVPLQVSAFARMRTAAKLRAGTGLAVGSMTGLAAVSCCSPLILPAILGLIGASGTTALSVNLTTHRWFLPLSGVTLVMISISGLLAVRDLTRGCRIEPAATALNPD